MKRSGEVVLVSQHGECRTGRPSDAEVATLRRRWLNPDAAAGPSWAPSHSSHTSGSACAQNLASSSRRAESVTAFRAWSREVEDSRSSGRLFCETQPASHLVDLPGTSRASQMPRSYVFPAAVAPSVAGGVCIAVFPWWAWFSHEREALSNGPRNSALSRSEAAQNPGFAVKLDQKIPFHLFCHWNVPAEHLDATSSLPYSCPLISDAQDFGHANGECRRTISFSERFEQKELIKEVAVDK